MAIYNKVCCKIYHGLRRLLLLPTDDCTAGTVASHTKPSLVDTVHQELRNQIILGDIQGGEVLVESKLAKLFGISKTPIREALVRLSQQGYVKVIPRQGYQVTSITVKDIHEIYELRSVLESEAAALAADRASVEDVQTLRGKIERTSAELSLKGGKVTALEVMGVDDAFHVGIATLAENGRLAAAIRRVLREAMRVRFSDPHESAEGLLSETRTANAILDAIESKDSATARELMLQHVAHSMNRVLGSLMDPRGAHHNIRVSGSSQ